MSRTKVISAGLLAGLIAAIAMTVIMLLLACFGVATPLVIIGDRLSVFIPPGPFLSIMGKVGGYNHLNQLGVGSTIAGQLVVGAIGGAIFGFCMRRDPRKSATLATLAVFVVLPIIAVAIALWRVLGTSYLGLPIDVARLATLVGFALCVFVFERTLTATFSYDGTQYKGRIVQPITPNDLFYCVTKNVVDPRVNVDLWHLEVTGLVRNRAIWRFQDQ